MKKEISGKKNVKKSGVKKGNNSGNKSFNFKEFITSTGFLTVVFILLLVLVVVLGVLIFKKSNEEKNKLNSDIFIPIIEKGANIEFKYDPTTLEKGEYIIKVSNFRKDIVNNSNIRYRIKIDNDTDGKIEVTTDEEDLNLMTDNKSTEFEGYELGVNKKKTIYYKIKVKNYENLKPGKYINVKVLTK